MKTCIGFIDAGFLRSEGAKALNENVGAVRPDASEVVKWFKGLKDSASDAIASSHCIFLRSYWYDSAFDPTHHNYAGQRSFFDAIAMTPGLQLRLGHIVEMTSTLEQPIMKALEHTCQEFEDLDAEKFAAGFRSQWKFRPTRQQKGVDSLIVLDMIRLASRSACDMIVLVAGDRDFVEVVRVVQEYGIKVLVATPRRYSVSRELIQVADELIDMSEATMSKILVPRQYACRENRSIRSTMRTR